MSEKKELNLEELENVTGGKIGTDDPHYEGFSGFVNMYALKENEQYYFVHPSRGIKWFRAKVLKTEEVKVTIFTTERTHTIEVTDFGNEAPSSTPVCKIRGDNFAAYTTKN